MFRTILVRSRAAAVQAIRGCGGAAARSSHGQSVAVAVAVGRPQMRWRTVGVVGVTLTAAAMAMQVSDARCSSKGADDEKTCAVADKLYDAHETEALHRFLLQAYSDAPDAVSGEVLWRFARACRDMSDLEEDAAKKQALVMECLAHAKRSVELEPDNFACHKWYAIGLSRAGDYKSTKERIGSAFEIREHFEAACRLNEKDATSRHLLGLWCFTFAELSWIERNLAAALFATPPQSTYEEALSHFEAAEAIEKGFYTKNTLMVGKTLLRMGRKSEAKEWLMAALAMQGDTPDDRTAHKEASELLKSC